MARNADTIMGKVAYANQSHVPVVNLGPGGQMGHHSDFRFYISNSAYVRRNTVAILVEAPRGFRFLDNPPEWVKAAKAIFEKMPQTFEGLRSTVTVENIETAVGGDGNMQQDTSNVLRERTQPVFTYVEKYGMPINKFLEGWIFNLIMNPVDKIPDVVKIPGNRGRVTDLLPDFNSATVLFFEPDPTFTYPQKAWLCTNMRPTSAGQVEGSRDMTQGGESATYNIEFTALTQIGVGVNNFAQRVLTSMNLNGTNPNLRDAFVTSISPDVEAEQSGYADQVAESSRTWKGPNV